MGAILRTIRSDQKPEKFDLDFGQVAPAASGSLILKLLIFILKYLVFYKFRLLFRCRELDPNCRFEQEHSLCISAGQ